MAKVHVKTGDTVMVISGKDRGNSGKVLQVSPKEGKVIVEGRNMVTKHVKPRRQGEQGGIVKAEARSCRFARSAARPRVWATPKRMAKKFASAKNAAPSFKKGSRKEWQDYRKPTPRKLLPL